MPVSAVEVRVLSRLLAQAQALPPEERDAWMTALPEVQQPLVPRLRERLAQISAPMPLDDAPPPPPPLRPVDSRHGEAVGPYRLLHPLGTDAGTGPGPLWQAERADDPARHPLALMLLPPDPAAAERQLTPLPAHPQVMRLRDAGIDAQGRPFRVMAWVEGVTLVAHARRRRLATPQRLQLVLQVCDVLAAAHAERVAHGDLRAANLLVDDEGRVTVLDWGLGRLLHKASAAADMQALMSQLQALLADSAHSAASAASPDLAAVQQRRYDRAEDLAADLQRVLDHQPVPGAHTTRLHRARLFVRRQRVPLAGGALALVVLAGVATWAVRQVQQGRDLAQRSDEAQNFIAQALPPDVQTLEPAQQAARLQQVLEQTRAGFAGQPVLRGQVLTELGVRFRALGQQDVALAVLREAVSLLQGTAAPGDPALLAAQAQLTQQQQAQQQPRQP